MRKLLNDPKNDVYALPIRTLKRARHQFKYGRTGDQIARGILMQMRKLADGDEVWLERCPVLQLPENDQLAVIVSRVEMADPQSIDHHDYKRLLRRLSARRYYKRQQARMTDEEREVYLAKKREYSRQFYKRNPDYNSNYQKRREEDPVGYLEHLEYQRQYRENAKSTPEGRARLAEHARRGRAKRKERMKTDPWFRESELQKHRQHQRRYRRLKKEEGNANH